MSKEKKLWIGFALVMSISFSVLGYYGYEIYQEAPPIPTEIVGPNNNVIFTAEEIKDGQNVWQSMGGQEVGTIWGHGAYVAPDWTADWLHREAVFILDKLSEKEYAKTFAELTEEQQATMKIRLQNDVRKNTYDSSTGIITISQNRIEAIAYLSKYYEGLFMDDPKFETLRHNYAIPKMSIKDPERMHKMNAFFFWATWATVTERPNQKISYTHNWPSDELVGNVATKDLLVWSGVSIILLLFCIGVLIFYHVRSGEDEHFEIPVQDPLLKQGMTPSMFRIKKYLWVVSLLIVLQVVMGVITAHYGVEGNGFFGIPLDQILPYAVTRTWHTQLAIFWIATAWLATGLYIAPAVAGKDPKFQTFGVDFLFYALILIVLGSMAGQWFGVMQKLNLVENFWFGHQGYEYVDLGRFWQIFLLVGLFLWLALMVRPLLPVLKKKTGERNLIIMFLISCTAIATFYAAGLMWGRQTNLAIAEYWRWWVVHLWVEGFFEVFATVVIAFLFVRLGLLKTKTATLNVIFSTIIFMSGGILGTFHHLYFSGTPTAVMALGATFSALEIVPLVLIGYEAYHNYKLSKSTQWIKDYKWPIYFMIAVAFWNFLGAGVFGFIINPPIALYYVQGLNTTPLHGHTALFGVYGMLGIGLMLFVLRSLYRHEIWNEKAMKFIFWSTNIGLLAMALLSLLPVGIWQAIESIEHGMWYARSAELMQQPAMVTLKWLRAIGDTIFGFGVLALCWFVFDLTLRKKS
ncbi:MULTISPECIES: nitric-oxide reductase large subunit [Flavobacterium]|uniref:Nitric oxide reductase subunit B n=3 Tax=Flavobacterium TaxID=237 RepID=A0A7W7IWU8_9FLAO|nr:MULTISPECIES: nitric-oxide reductase large subunit [Flavobacterium]MBB4802059.1 nitric oxide reductase subunit B [Flavobacterium nitrogenifigens]MBB6387017.1 nitric oxide reductase subunit B [Flavobacterium notoginsengisoli]WET02925.1 nitric-oxide reductase large subunit [Flavobacterium sp. YJ01]